MDMATEAPQQRGVERMDPIRYTSYLKLLDNAFGRLLSYYGEVEREAQTTEGESMALYIEKILQTVKVLRLKHSFSPEYFQRPGVDLADSGFPNYHDVSTLDTDLATRGERLPKLLETDLLKRMLLDVVMHPSTPVPVRQSEEVRKLQWQIAERAFLEQLDLRAQLFRFTPGKLFSADPKTFSKEKGRRGYHFSWGCYDFEKNRPAVYFLVMTQDDKDIALDERGNPEYERFLKLIDNNFARVPDRLDVVGVRIDEAFRTLYPKALKRFVIGPLVSPLLWEGKGLGACSPLAQHLAPIFAEAELSKDDFVLIFSTEMVVSEREETPSFTLKAAIGLEKPRQIFHVPKDDRKLLARGATAYKTYCILPHRLRQHLNDERLAALRDAVNAEDIEMLAYQPAEEGVTNVG